MEAATAAMLVKAALSAGTSKKFWTGVASVAAAVFLPVILLVMCVVSIGSAGSDHNRSAVRLSFDGGSIPQSMPADYRAYIGQMQACFSQIDTVMDGIDALAEGEKQDRDLLKAVFYSLYFGSDHVRLAQADYTRFANCFVEHETRTRTMRNANGSETVTTYEVTVAITDKARIFEKLAVFYGKEITSGQQTNAMNVWYLAKFHTSAPKDTDVLGDWSGLNQAEAVVCYNLPESEAGGQVVELAMSRLGDPYSQERRGQGDYVDCSYLTMWCYKKVGIILPGTAAEQGRYLVEHKLTVSKDALKPGDLVFWSYEPNGRFMNITHVGVYAGEGKVIDASGSAGKVVYRNLFDSDKQVLYGRPK